MPNRVRLASAPTQRDALEQVAALIRKGSIDEKILRAAKAITRDCASRDDQCEIEAIYDAVRNGTERVDWLRHGVRYVADPEPFDAFHSTRSIISFCSDGSCAFDCDDQTILVASLAAALGFKTGARAWGPGKAQNGDYVHVYPVVAIPKSGPWPRDYYGTGCDTTVDKGVGWEPPGGHILTAWLE